MTTLSPLDDYDEERDIQFFAGTGDLFKIEGMFAVFFPHDAHMPSLAVQGAGEQVVKKMVIKSGGVMRLSFHSRIQHAEDPHHSAVPSAQVRSLYPSISRTEQSLRRVQL